MSKKLLHKFNYYLLEEEDQKILFDEYLEIFNNDFDEEIQFHNLNNKDTYNDSDKKEDKKQQYPEEAEVFHSIFREIVKNTHPDRFGEQYIKEFKRANEAFSSENWIVLIVVASNLGLEIPDFNKQEVQLIENNIERIESKIDQWRESVVWSWSKDASVNRKKLRKTIRKAMGINEEQFQEFLKNKSSQE